MFEKESTRFKILILSLFFVPFLGVSQLAHKNSNLKIAYESYAEKVYLQLDNNVYVTGKTIWFKGIVTNAINHATTKKSGVLYVELIDPLKNILDKKILKLENGISDSFFELDKKYASGRYLIRAYTKWNKNFQQDFMFTKYIDIFSSSIDSKEKEPIKNLKLTKSSADKLTMSADLYPEKIDNLHKGKLTLGVSVDEKKEILKIKKSKQGVFPFEYLISEDSEIATLDLQTKNKASFIKTIAINKENLDLRFFPESGELVDGLTSAVGFKAVDINGKGKNVSGEIVDGKGNTLTIFKTNHLGMGTLYLFADSDQKYFGKVTDNLGNVTKFPLPQVSKKGNVLSVTERNSAINVHMVSNYLENDSVYLRVRSRGIPHHYLKTTLKDQQFYASIEKESLPEGIVELTVFDRNKQAICERLYFNNKENKRLNISLKTKKNKVNLRDKTSLEINVLDKNSKPVRANLSVVVVNKDLLGEINSKRENILSYLLLNSELKGDIENPGYYFKDTNKKKLNDLNSLLLTQGWRKYKYEKEQKEFKFQSESSLTVSGTVASVLNNKRKKKDIDLTMLTFGVNGGVYKYKTDSLGRFKFNLNDYGETLNILIRSANKKGKKKEYLIKLDEQEKEPLVFYDQKKNITVLNSDIDTFIKKNIKNEQIVRNFEVAQNPEINSLDEVFLDNYKLTPQREKVLKLYGKPDVVIESKELEKKIKKWSFGLYGLLDFNFPGDLRFREVGSRFGSYLRASVIGRGATYVLVDGIPVYYEDYHMIPGIPTSEVKSVEIIKRPKNRFKHLVAIYGVMPANLPQMVSFISIYTHRGIGLFGVSKAKGMFKRVIEGYTSPREFYAPLYKSKLSKQMRKPDLRSLIHWEPKLITDIDGAADVEFYNADIPGEMLVLIEAITEDGQIGYHEFTYDVLKK